MAKRNTSPSAKRRTAVFASPFLVALLGIPIYYSIAPRVSGKAVPVVEWMFSEATRIFAAVRGTDQVLPLLQGVDVMRIFFYIWIACWIASLFFVGRELQKKPVPSPSVGFTKKDLHLETQEALGKLNFLFRRTQSSHELTSVVAAVQRLEEKLRTESDFGIGGEELLALENQIALEIRSLSVMANAVAPDTISETAQSIEDTAQTIQILLTKRIALKRR